MSNTAIGSSELIVNNDGSVYHLHVRPEDLADTVILVGDPGRVDLVSSKFSKIDFKVSNREFVTHTGSFNGKRISVTSTGIGTDNVDIVVNELDALVNIDFKSRRQKDKLSKLTLVRLGTSGALHEDILVDSIVASSHGIGFDGLLNYYKSEHVVDKDLVTAFEKQTDWAYPLPYPYIVKGSTPLIEKLAPSLVKGITATAGGFYGPQGRVLRIQPYIPDLNEKLQNFGFMGHRITNFEMETSALYGLSALLGHDACTLCTIVANRVRKEFSKDYKTAVDKMVDYCLERLTS
jgi:uridine phosphorylase